ncbi:Lipid-binding serum glycoprotein family protein [Heracleum sosnowskyi]|uniref:Lipid-binding serum glycoprotein family protein n=1 Tax=Heracleum sosnowskyi TaxID=360622 RepID=A0AAD8ITM2_9APIA|nr:Lipid-binding serum glycoprotein family protein [Heracleum sosnowskyi]
MAYVDRTIFSGILYFLIISSCPYLHVHCKVGDEGYISLQISEKGLNFVKDLVVKEAVSSLTPLHLPQVEKPVKIPFLGTVQIVLSNITINHIDLPSSIIKTGQSGITLATSSATANLTMAWRYSYSSWLLPIDVSDQGDASIQVDGMEVGLTLSLENQQGNLKLSLLECGCYVRDISIQLNGGASWLYQGVADAFNEDIISSVEDAVSNKIKDGIIYADSLLKSVPKEIPIDNVAAINVTFVNDPMFSDSSFELEIDGLINANDETVVSSLQKEVKEDSNSCEGLNKMIWISLHEKVLVSAVSVYFEADMMQWVVDQLPDQSLLNTAGWRYIVPQLYKKFPNDDMKLNISISSTPTIKIERQNIDVTVDLDMTVYVVNFGELVPVACISTMISATGFPKISMHKLGGSVKLTGFAMDLKWSEIGSLHMTLIKTFVSATLKTVVLPYLNILLWEGFPLPSFHGYELRNAEILSDNSKFMICSDVASKS